MSHDGELETWWDSGDMEYPRPPVTADHTLERMSAATQEVTHLFERVAWKVHDHDGNLVGYHIEADMWREVRAHFLAAHLADVEARLAPVEALVRELHISGDLTPAGTDALLRALHPDPSEGRP